MSAPAAASEEPRDHTRPRDLLLVVVIGLAVLLPGIGPQRGLWNPDEPRFGEIARAMVASGDWSIPKLNGEPYSNKPPLFTWSIAVAGLATGGVDERAARLPSALSAVGVLCLTFVLGRRLGGRRLGWLAVMVLGTSFRFLWQSGWGQTDMLLTFFVVLAITGYDRVARRGRVGGWDFVALYVGCALGTLTKGLPGIVLPGLVAFVDVVRRKAWRELAHYRIPSGTLAYLTITLPWFVWAGHREGAAFLENLIIRQHFQRYVDAFDHAHGPLHYLLTFPVEFMPWSLLLPATAYFLWTNRSERGELRFPILWFATIVLFFSLSGSKRGQYLLPAYPAAALLVAACISEALRGSERCPWAAWFERPLIALRWIALGLIPVVVAGLPVTHMGLEVTSHPLIFQGFEKDVRMGVLAAVLMVPPVVAALRLGRQPKWGAVAGTVVLALAAHLVLRSVILPGLDHHKSARPFVAKVDEALPDGGRLAAYEFWRGYFNFYLGRDRIELLPDLAAAAAFLSEGVPSCLITRTKQADALHRSGTGVGSPVLLGRIGSKEVVLLCSSVGSSAARHRSDRTGSCRERQVEVQGPAGSTGCIQQRAGRDPARRVQ